MLQKQIEKIETATAVEILDIQQEFVEIEKQKTELGRAEDQNIEKTINKGENGQKNNLNREQNFFFF